MTGLTDEEILAAFEEFNVETRKEIDRHVEERLASMKCPLESALEARAAELKELDQRLRALEERTVIASSRRKMSSALRRWL